MNIIRYFHSGKIKESRGIIDILNQLIALCSGFDMSRIAHHERGTERLLVHETLIEPAVFTEPESLIGCVNHNGIVSQSVLVNIIEYFAYTVIE